MLCSRVETETIISIKQDIKKKKKILPLFQETFQFLFWIHVGKFPMNPLTQAILPHLCRPPHPLHRREPEVYPTWPFCFKKKKETRFIIT